MITGIETGALVGRRFTAQRRTRNACRNAESAHCWLVPDFQLNRCAGARYHLVPASSRDSAYPHSDIYFIHDFRSKAFEISSTSLSGAAESLRTLDSLRGQGARVVLPELER